MVTRAMRLSLPGRGRGYMEDNFGVMDNAPVNFFSMIPHMVDDSNISPQAKSLYLHLKRVAGEDGLCWKTQDQLAEHCGFSPKTIVKAKRELIEAKIIEIKLEAFEGHPRHVIHLLNIWTENERKYRQSVSNGTDNYVKRIPQSVSKGTAIGIRRRATKKNPKEEPLKNTPGEEPLSFSSKKPRAPKLHTRPIFAEMQKEFGYPERIEKDPIPNYGKEAKSVDRMLKRGYTEAEILEAWRTKVRARGEFVSMVYVNEDIGKPDRPKQASFLPDEDRLAVAAKGKGLL